MPKRLRKLPSAQRGVLTDLFHGKPWDYGYPKGYRWQTGTMNALLRKGLCKRHEEKPNDLELTDQGREWVELYLKGKRQDQDYPPGDKHPMVVKWWSNKLQF